MSNYPSNLTESKYKAILAIIGDKRKRQHSLKDVLDAMLYLLKTGFQWRMLPSNFPKRELVYYYFYKWSRDGTSNRYMKFCETDFGSARTKASPSVGIIDSQSVKTTKTGGDVEVSTVARRSKAANGTLLPILRVCSWHANEHDSSLVFGF